MSPNSNRRQPRIVVRLVVIAVLAVVVFAIGKTLLEPDQAANTAQLSTQTDSGRQETASALADQSQKIVEQLLQASASLRDDLAPIVRADFLIEAMRNIAESEPHASASELSDWLQEQGIDQQVFDFLLVSVDGTIRLSAKQKPWRNQIANLQPSSNDLLRIIHQLRIRFENQILFDSELDDPVWAELSRFPQFDNRTIGFMVYPIAGDDGDSTRGIAATDLLGYALVAIEGQYFAPSVSSASSSALLLTGTDTTIVAFEPAEPKLDSIDTTLHNWLALPLATQTQHSTDTVYLQSLTVKFGNARPWYLVTFAP